MGVQPLEPGLAGMDAESAGAAAGHRVHKLDQLSEGITFVDSDAVLHRDREATGLDHGLHAIGHLFGFGHQAGAEPPLNHLGTGTTHVQVDLVVAPLGCQGGSLGQNFWVVAP